MGGMGEARGGMLLMRELGRGMGIRYEDGVLESAGCLQGFRSRMAMVDKGARTGEETKVME